MKKYESRFKSLSFYVNGERKRFRNGLYETKVKAEKDVLDKLIDVKTVEQPKKSAPKKPAKAEQPKASTKSKSSAKK